MHRAFLTKLHRYIGLTAAVFLVAASLTGSIIAFHTEVDAWLNPELFLVSSRGMQLPLAEMAARVQDQKPEIYITSIRQPEFPGLSAVAYVRAHIDPVTGARYSIAFNQIFIDPTSGALLGQRNDKEFDFSRAQVIPFLYSFHYSLHMPGRWGVWLMGAVAILWMVDCFVGFYLTLPTRHRKMANREPAVDRQLARGWLNRWASAWKVKTTGSPYRVTFDIHRAFGLWTWMLLLVLALTGASMNFYNEAARPILKMLTGLSETPYDRVIDRSGPARTKASVSIVDIADIALAEANVRGLHAQIGRITYVPSYRLYGISFYIPGDELSATAGGSTSLYFDSETGALIGDQVPWGETGGDKFLNLQFPLHSGRIFGFPGRVLISIMGLVVTTLTVTGLVIWYRKRRAHILAGQHR